MAKKFYWLKLKRDFFKTKEIKKLRKMAGGDTFTIIYLEMQLLSLENNGKIYYDGVEESFAEELALELDEDPDNVLFTLTFLEKCGWIEKGEEDEFILPQAIDAIGRENPSAERVRRHREKTKALQCNADVTPCNKNETLEKEIDKERELEKEIPPIIPFLRRAFGDFVIRDDAGVAHKQIVSRLEEIGFECKNEYPVLERGDGRSGRIDVMAVKGSSKVVIEIDRETPREKSIAKLSQVEDAVKVIFLRDGGKNIKINGIDAVISLKTEGKGQEGLAKAEATNGPTLAKKATNAGTLEEAEQTSQPVRARKKHQEVDKMQYAEFVRMTEKEYQSLTEQVGETGVKRCIEILDNYKGSTGKTYKDDYRAIRSWVIDRLREEQAKQRRYAPYGKKQEAPSNPQMAMAQRAIEMLGGMDDDAGSEDY